MKFLIALVATLLLLLGCASSPSPDAETADSAPEDAQSVADAEADNEPTTDADPEDSDIEPDVEE